MCWEFVSVLLFVLLRLWGYKIMISYPRIPFDGGKTWEPYNKNYTLFDFEDFERDNTEAEK
jgi:hypothetical protein